MPERGNTPVFFKCVASAGLTVRAAKLTYCCIKQSMAMSKADVRGAGWLAADMQSTSGPLKPLHSSPRWSARPH